jgi:hypothetical protein
MKRREDVLLRAAGVHRIEHERVPSAVRELVLVLVREQPIGPIARHHHVEDVRHAEHRQHREPELREQVPALRHEQHRQHVDGEQHEVVEVEEREPLRRRVRDEAIQEQRRLHAEEADVEVIERLVVRA